MPVNATIPLTQDFLETATSYPFLTELVQHPTDGYLYGCYHSSALFGSMIRVKADNFSDITTVEFANDGQHANPVDMVYVPSTDRFYVLFRNGDANRCVISAVTPSTLARVDFFNFEDIQVGAGSITADATNLYVVTFPTTPSYLVIIPIAAPGTFAEPTPLTGFSQAHCVRQFGGKLFAQGMTPPTTSWVMRLTTAGVVEETATFTGEEGEFPVDEIGESSGHIWVGNRDLLGEIRKYSKTSFINPEVILTTQLSKCTCVKTIGSYVWAAFENGRGVRINPANVADRRIYTLNAGEGYHSEFTGGNEFVYTYNYFEGKIARYHIPPDVTLTSGALQWVNVTTVSGATSSAITLNGVTHDSSGNVIVVGQFTGTMNFGDGNVTSSPATVTDVAIAKYSGDGALIWKKIIGGTSPDVGIAISSYATDVSGNIFVIGTFRGTVEFGDSHPLTSESNTDDVFVAKYSAGSQGVPGTCLWAQKFGNADSDVAHSIVADAAGDVFISLRCVGNVTIGAFPTTALGMYDIILAKLDSSTGIPIWAKRWGGTGQDYCYGLAVDGSGDLWACGQTAAGGNLGAGADTATAGGFIVKYNGSDGTYANWSKIVAGTGNPVVFHAIAIDAAGFIYVTGKFGNTANFGGGTINMGSFSGGIIIVSYNPALAPASAWRWNRWCDGGGDDNAGYGVGVNSTLGKVLIAGKSRAQLNFLGAGFLLSYGPFIACFLTADGTFKWAQNTDNGTGNGKTSAISVAGNFAAVTGGFTGTVKFSSTVSKTANSSIAAVTDGFIAQYAI